MAILSIDLPESLMNQIGRAANLEAYAPKMIEAEENVVYPEVIRRLASHHKTGALERSIKKTSPKMDKKGIWRGQIKPTGYDTQKIKGGGTKRVSNNQKMLSLEYGTSKQLATPVMRPAKAAKEGEAEQAAQEVFNQAVMK